MSGKLNSVGAGGSFFVGVAVGVSVSLALHLFLKSKSKPAVDEVDAVKGRLESRMPAALCQVQCDDDCLSLCYDFTPDNNGRGFPDTGSVPAERIQAMQTVHPEFKRLSSALYKDAVENLPIACVDVICQRRSDKKLLLFFRRDKPAASIWWWPGGRLLRGETFYQAATRKLREETGNPQLRIEPVGVVGVWNTFFPDSSWDEGRASGKEGTQTVNVSVVCRVDCGDNEFSVDAKAGARWAVEDHQWVSAENALSHGLYDKYVRLNVERAEALGYLL